MRKNGLPSWNRDGRLVSIANAAERRQYHTPCTPVMMAANEIKRPIPENNAIVTSSSLPDFSDAAAGTGIRATTRTAFDMSGSP
jgi:hypothetical protein